MLLAAPAIVLSTRVHGEHGLVVRALTEQHGVCAGYVRGGRGRRLRPVLQPGNSVLGEWRARTTEQLAAMTVELVHSRAPLWAEPLPAAAIEWTCALTAAALPEAQPYPALYGAFDGLLAAVEAAARALDWAAALARYELLLLGELGFGLDLERCVVSGSAEALDWVSPKSGGAVSRAAAAGYEPRLFALPPFLRASLQEGRGAAAWGDIHAGLRVTGHFLTRDILTDRNAPPLAARERLMERLKRAGRGS